MLGEAACLEPALVQMARLVGNSEELPMSSLSNQRLLRTLIDLREEANKCDRAADNDRSPYSAAAATYRGYSEGITFAVDEIVAALRIQGEETVDLRPRPSRRGRVWRCPSPR
jgi:hypothetical protein